MTKYNYRVIKKGSVDEVVSSYNLNDYLTNRFGSVKSKMMIEDLNYTGRHRSSGVSIVRLVDRGE